MRNFWDEFKAFALKGSVLDLAIGIIIGAAFSNIVNSLVNDIIMPPLGLLLNNVDFKELYINLSDTDYESLAAAKDAGAPTINYGMFINALISFLIVALVIFIIVKQINRLRSKPEELPPTIKECPYCFSNIPIKATRCPECTSQLEAGKATPEAAAQ
jgi:large conductance mechanosensitive channel